ncbi:hypothetical protein EXN66_Car007480 [Channa argus]|uniref:Ig-like domain-containing protein n=1 Tax=Channa argus TaxID=215402 RepID=A0A6G1PNF5_CHAAH|nr:hypothetical protein EXN66_Car007480 [Channa argus]
MACFYLHCLLFLPLLIFRSECKADQTITDTVSASQGEDAVLPCFNSTVMDPKGCYRVRLIKYATDGSQVKKISFAWPKNMQNANRVKWETGGDGKLHFYLTKLQKSDEGQYSCEVCQGWDCNLIKNISLKVKDCKISPAVRAAPRTSIILNCPAEMVSGQQGLKNVSWSVLKGGKPQSVNSKRVNLNDTSLIISSVNDNDNDWYRCQYPLEQSQPCFDIRLIVQEENVKTTFVPVITLKAATQDALTKMDPILANTSQESTKAYIAVVASVITVTVIISALIGIFIYHRRNTLRVTQQAWNHQAGCVRDSDGYDNVNLAGPRDSLHQQENIIYQQYEDGNLCTFHY